MSFPIRYSRLGYASLHVTDLAASLHFYVDLMGLMHCGSDGQEAWLRCSDKPYDLILTQGDVAGLARIGFELESRDELERAFCHLTQHDLRPAWSAGDLLSKRQVEAAFSFRNLQTGLEIEFYVGQARAQPRYQPTVAKISRLGHVVLNVNTYADAHRFWVDKLGFAISDQVPGKIAFLRCFPNPLHHTLALLQADRDGLNHINFMVTDIDDVGCAINRMKKAGVPIVFGPGRHLPSTSIFLYFLDPDGMTAEYSFGMEEITEHADRAPRTLDPTPEVLDTWGSVPALRFGKAGIIIRNG